MDSNGLPSIHQQHIQFEIYHIPLYLSAHNLSGVSSFLTVVKLGGSHPIANQGIANRNRVQSLYSLSVVPWCRCSFYVRDQTYLGVYRRGGVHSLVGFNSLKSLVVLQWIITPASPASQKSALTLWWYQKYRQNQS